MVRGFLLRAFLLLTCEQAEKLSYDFLEEKLPRARMAQMHLHMITCPACLRFMRSYRRTKDLRENLPKPKLNPQFKEAILQFMIAEQTAN